MSTQTTSPSQEEIAAACEEIRAGWDRQTERSRRGLLADDDCDRWMPQTISAAAVSEAAGAASEG
jgi:hypothetical protein